jgi:hypothetical protein
MIAGLSRRVENLEGPYRHGDGECRYGPTVILGEGESAPPDAPACPHCGDVHALIVIEQVVVSRDAADEVRAADAFGLE